MKPATTLSWLLLPLALGCGGMAIDGQVVDAGGTPVPGAMVTVVSTPCNAIVGDDGKFSVPCTPGSYDLIISADGYTTVETKVDAPERDRYDIGKQTLIKIPSEKGLYSFVANAWTPLKVGRLTRNLDQTSDQLSRAYCLDSANSEANNVAAGEASLFDMQYGSWRPFRLDEDGCAYRDVKGQNNKWQVTYKDKPDYQEKEVQQDMVLATMELPAGQYFIADWKQGFFTPSEDDKHSYTGFWLKVE